MNEERPWGEDTVALAEGNGDETPQADTVELRREEEERTSEAIEHPAPHRKHRHSQPAGARCI